MYPILVSALPVSSTMGVISASLPPSILSGINRQERGQHPFVRHKDTQKK